MKKIIEKDLEFDFNLLYYEKLEFIENARRNFEKFDTQEPIGELDLLEHINSFIDSLHPPQETFYKIAGGKLYVDETTKFFTLT
jgi:hypothetical protein